MEHQPLDFIQKLIQRNILTRDQLQIAQIEAKRHNANVLQTIIQLGFITIELIHELQNEQSTTHQKINLSNCFVDSEILKSIPKLIAKKYFFLPIALDIEQKTLSIAMTNIHNLPAFDECKRYIKDSYGFIPQIKGMVASQEDILNAIEKHYPREEIDRLALHSEQVDYFAQQFVENLLVDAVHKRASDIHIQPEQHFIRIRYRIDGVLHQQKMLHRQYLSMLTNRLKIVSHVDIAEQRNVQDGHFSATIEMNSLDIRSSFLPTIHGENIVLRLLHKQKNLLDLKQICVFDWQYELIQEMLQKPTGLILLTGPTGSGKTTTLYSMLNQQNQVDKHIITLEDPVEYVFPMINQVNMSDYIKFNFAEGIRAVLRQDPDIILIGEIRDEETAQMAFRASMTGHQVYSTLHTNSAFGAFGRLLDMGISRNILSDQNINGIINQRLVRKLCPECKEYHLESKSYLANPTGCYACHYTGYHGQFALMEILPMTRQLEFLIDQHSSIQTLHHYLNDKAQSKLVSLQSVAKQVIENGLTSLQEIQRSVGN